MKLLKSPYHFLLAWLGNIVYLFPSRKIFVVGVTGTKGKSSTLAILDAILISAGKKTALLSSAQRKIGDRVEKNSSGNTMPGRLAIQKFLRAAVRSGAEYALVEVTSQGVAQFRDRFIHWDAAFFTNIHPEHIESHGSFENYRAAKVRFFGDVLKSKKKRKLFFINRDDENGKYFAEAVQDAPGAEVFYFVQKEFVDKSHAWGWNLETTEGRKTVSDWLIPDFNIVNAAAAAKFAEAVGLSEERVQQGIVGFKGLAGRFEVVQKEPFLVMVDYAHTPDSLRGVYSSVRSSFLKSSPGKMICVLGSAGGGRDKWKRSVMGSVAAEFCDEIILTNEDPYDEDPERIMNEIGEGMKNYGGKLLKVADRRDAMRKAIEDAGPGDAIVATGKGSESSIHIARGKTIPWNEREVVRGLLAEFFHKNDEA